MGQRLLPSEQERQKQEALADFDEREELTIDQQYQYIDFIVDDERIWKRVRDGEDDPLWEEITRQELENEIERLKDWL